jgi:hypothetical protein
MSLTKLQLWHKLKSKNLTKNISYIGTTKQELLDLYNANKTKSKLSTSQIMKMLKNPKQKVKAVKNKYADFVNRSLGRSSVFEGDILDFINNVNIPFGYNLVIGINNNYTTISNLERLAEFKNEIQTFIENQLIIKQNHPGSDYEVIYEMIHNPNPTIEVEFVKKGSKPTGGYFKYYHKLDKIDLTRYGIYRNEEEANYETNCLEIALKSAGYDINSIKTILKTRFIPQKDLDTIAKYLKIHIKLTTYQIDGNTRTIHYNKSESKQINIALYDEHYFLIEKTNYTSYSIKNYNDINELKDFNKIYIKKNNIYEKSDNRFISSLDLIKIIINNENLREEITLQNGGIKNIYNNKLFDYKDLTYSESNIKLCENYGISPYFDEEPFEIIFFDFESTTDEDIHKPYLVCDSRGKFFVDPQDFLKSLTQNTILIAHNLRYDLQFLIKYIDQAKDIIQTGNKVRQLKGKFYNKITKQTIKLVFKDSYSLIEMRLFDFSKCFNLTVKKEIMPYELYNKNTINISSVPLEQAIGYLKESEIEEFINNANDINSIIVVDDILHINHLEYAKFYCFQDVNLLKQGYMTFRQWMIEVTNIDINYIISIPQLANKFGLDKGIFDGTYKISGVPRDFIQRCIVGGRCMTRRNEKIEVEGEVDDFDGVSLYPSAMNRLEGFLFGKPKVLTNEMINGYIIENGQLKFNKKVDGYFLEINILDIPIKRDFPLVSKIEDGIRKFSNDIRGSVYVDKTILEDLIKFHDIKFRIIRGYYFDEGRNDKIKDFMRMLFNERLQKKKEKNPIQQVYKLIMNAFYGKLIQKPIDNKVNFIYGKKKSDNFLKYNFNNITSFVKISDGMTIFNQKKSIVDHFNSVHLGVEVLSMSKRIMNEVMCLAEDNNMNIYYTDTDSMHIDHNSVELLAQKFEEKYNRELIGTDLGQFHTDFNFKSDSEPVAVKCIFLGKKSYVDIVRITENGLEKFDYHLRMKGIPNRCLKKKSEEFNSPFDMYMKMYDGKEVEFDLLDCCKFKVNKNFTTSNNTLFKRVLSF